MKGVSYITDSNNNRKAVIIELKAIEQYREKIEDLLDVIVADARKNDEKVPLKKVIANLKKAGKLKK